MKNTFAIQLLKSNLKYHKDNIKRFSKGSSNDYILNQLKQSIEIKEDLESAIDKLK